METGLARRQRKVEGRAKAASDAPLSRRGRERGAVSDLDERLLAHGPPDPPDRAHSERDGADGDEQSGLARRRRARGAAAELEEGLLARGPTDLLSRSRGERDSADGDEQSGLARRRRARGAAAGLEEGLLARGPPDLPNRSRGERDSADGDEQSGLARRRRARAGATEPRGGEEGAPRSRSERRRERRSNDDASVAVGATARADLDVTRAQSTDRRRGNRAQLPAGALDRTTTLRPPGETSLENTQTLAEPKLTGNLSTFARRISSAASSLTMRSMLGTRNRDRRERDGADSDDEALPAFDRLVLFKRGSLAATSYEEAAAERQVLSVVVHRTDELPADYWIIHPIVRVHIFNERTGKLLRKSERERPVTTAHEHATRAEPGKGSRTRELSYILPTQTQPHELRGQRRRLPAWEEELLLNEDFAHVLHPEVLIIFELLDFSPSVTEKHVAEKMPDGWYHVAWAFLRPVAQSGTCSNLHRQMPLRLQLYRHQLAPTDMPSAGAPGARAPGVSARSPAVWAEYSHERYAPYPSTLFVTVRTVARPQPQTVVYPYRPMAAHHVETGRLTVEELVQQPIAGYDAGGGEPPPSVAARAAELLKLPTEVPNAMLFNAHGGGVGAKALRFSPSGEWLAVATLRAGIVVSGAAAATASIAIFETLTGRQRHVLPPDGLSHALLVHDLAWQQDEGALVSASSDGTAKVWQFTQSLSALSALGASATLAANDRGARAGGRAERGGGGGGDAGIAREAVVLQHGCFVYAALFLPHADERDDALRVVTGAYDGCVRVWAVRAGAGAVERRLERHRSGVNCLALSSDATRLASADGDGTVHVWSADGASSGAVATAGARRQTQTQSDRAAQPPSAADPFRRSVRGSVEGASARRGGRVAQQAARGLFEWVACPTEKLPGTRGKPIDTVRYHPSGKRLLIGVRDNQLFAFDLRLQLVLRHYTGLHATSAPVRAVYSPDGRYVVSGSEDGDVRSWHEESGVPLQLPPCGVGARALAPITDVDWSPLDSALACCAFVRGSPVVCWAFDPSLEQNPSLAALERALVASALARPMSPHQLGRTPSRSGSLVPAGAPRGVAQRLTFASAATTPVAPARSAASLSAVRSDARAARGSHALDPREPPAAQESSTQPAPTAAVEPPSLDDGFTLSSGARDDGALGSLKPSAGIVDERVAFGAESADDSAARARRARRVLSQGEVSQAAVSR